MALNYAVPYGKIKLVLYDDREGSSIWGELMELFPGLDNYILVTNYSSRSVEWIQKGGDRNLNCRQLCNDSL